jgi:hypothetical protein
MSNVAQELPFTFRGGCFLDMRMPVGQPGRSGSCCLSHGLWSPATVTVSGAASRIARERLPRPGAAWQAAEAGAHLRRAP